MALLRNPRYEKLKDLGKGTYGDVILCQDNVEDRLVAIKLLKRGTPVRDAIVR